MQVKIIDDKHQSFNGIVYHRHKRGYYINMNLRLHCEVWKFHNGKIPAGYEIHHIDQDKANNQIENLQCLTRKEHCKIHVELKRAQGLFKPIFICQRCGKSFTSQAQEPQPYCRECRKELYPKKKTVKPFKPRRFRTCIVCGKIFEVKGEARRNKHRTCSPECREKTCPPPIPMKICKICGKEFKPRHSWSVCCSPECGAKFNGLNRRGKPTGEKAEYVVSKCEWCGKEIRHRKKEQPRFCSQDCLHKFLAKRNSRRPLKA